MSQNKNLQDTALLNKLLNEYLEDKKCPSALKDIENFERTLQNSMSQSFLSYVIGCRENQIITLNTVANELENMDLLQACFASHFCGALINDVGVQQAGKPIIDLFSKVIVLASNYVLDIKDTFHFDEEKLNSEIIEQIDKKILFLKCPDNMRAYMGCELLTLAVMEVIARDSNARFYLREKDIYKYIDFLRYFQPNLYYVTQTYHACSNLKITILAPSVQKGFEILVNDITNCFHLFTLLEAEIYKKGWMETYHIKDYIWDEELYQIAVGIQYPNKNYKIQTHQQYYTYKALQPDNSYRILLKNPSAKQLVDPDTLVWGEMFPEQIPSLYNERIILIDKKGMFAERNWDISFVNKCHDNLNPTIEILNELSDEQYNLLIEKIKTANQ